MVANKSVIFKKVPTALPVEGEHLVIEQNDFDLDQAPPQGGITVKVNYVSFDPYMRGRMRSADIKSYVPGFELNKPISNFGIATVLKSDSSKFKKDDVVQVLSLQFSEYAAVGKEIVDNMCQVLDNPHGIDPQIFLGALGMPGLTAYSSFHEIGQPKKGETILISAAAGAVGQVVGQLAKHEGLKVIGSVGDDKKLDFITKELGFDAGFNYKKESPADALKRLAPDGIDIYFENVGGEHLEAALDAMNNHGRVIACGMISQYNLPSDQKYGIKNLMQVVSKRITMRGFIAHDSEFGPAYTKRHQEQLQPWIKDGSFKPKTDTTEGIDNAIKGFLGLYNGNNFGKAVLSVSPF